MPERKVVVTHEVGLHARPAALFVKEARKFDSTITVQHKGKSANARSILDVITLDATQNAELIIAAEGADAEAALDALERVLDGG